MKKLLCLLGLVLLVGCDSGYKEHTGYVMPHELNGCKVFSLNDSNPLKSSLKVIVCPQYDCVSDSMYDVGAKTNRNVSTCY